MPGFRVVTVFVLTQQVFWGIIKNSKLIVILFEIIFHYVRGVVKLCI